MVVVVVVWWSWWWWWCGVGGGGHGVVVLMVVVVVWWWWWSVGDGGDVVVVVVVVADIYLAYLSLLLSLTCNLFYFVQHQLGAASNHLGGSPGSHFGPSQPGPSSWASNGSRCDIMHLWTLWTMLVCLDFGLGSRDCDTCMLCLCLWWIVIYICVIYSCVIYIYDVYLVCNDGRLKTKKKLNFFTSLPSVMTITLDKAGILGH